jgi:hypothetical protein
MDESTITLKGQTTVPADIQRRAAQMAKPTKMITKAPQIKSESDGIWDLLFASVPLFISGLFRKLLILKVMHHA